jgi:hypothetical protein
MALIAAFLLNAAKACEAAVLTLFSNYKKHNLLFFVSIAVHKQDYTAFC